MSETSKSLCPLCHRTVEKLVLLDLEGSSFLLCEECLHDPSLQKRLSILEEDALDDAQYEDEDLE